MLCRILHLSKQWNYVKHNLSPVANAPGQATNLPPNFVPGGLIELDEVPELGDVGKDVNCVYFAFG
jgi:hypothetical protein